MFNNHFCQPYLVFIYLLFYVSHFVHAWCKFTLSLSAISGVILSCFRSQTYLVFICFLFYVNHFFVHFYIVLAVIHVCCTLYLSAMSGVNLPFSQGPPGSKLSGCLAGCLHIDLPHCLPDTAPKGSHQQGLKITVKIYQYLITT